MVTLPMLHMAGRYVHIDRRGDNHRHRLDHDRLRVNNRRREAPDVEAAIKSRLADADGDAYVGCLRRRCGNEGNYDG